MPKTMTAAAQAAAVACAIPASAPKTRIRLILTSQILEEDMVIMRGNVAWFGCVRPEDSQHVSFTRNGKRYLLAEGEFSLYRRK